MVAIAARAHAAVVAQAIDVDAVRRRVGLDLERDGLAAVDADVGGEALDLGSPEPLTSHSVERIPGLQFSATTSLAGEAQAGAWDALPGALLRRTEAETIRQAIARMGSSSPPFPVRTSKPLHHIPAGRNSAVTRNNPRHIGPVQPLTMRLARHERADALDDLRLAARQPALGIRLRQERMPKPKPKISIVSYGTTTVTWFDSPLSRLPANACTETK